VSRSHRQQPGLEPRGRPAPALRQASLGVKSVGFSSSPLLAERTPPWRSRFAVAVLALAFGGLLVRAVYVQAVRDEFYQAQGEARFLHTQALPASRGQVLDRHGQPLAQSVAMPSVHVEIGSFAADVAQRKAMAQILGMKPAELDDRLDGKGTVLVRRHVEEELWQTLQGFAKEQKIRGVHAQREFARRWPEGEAAAHVVGFTNPDGEGLEGIELAFDERLQATPGQQTVVRDRLGRVIEHLGDRSAAPKPGQDIRLSIDAKVQFFAWQRLREAVQEHGAQSGSAVVLDARSGEILALANYPSYDPAKRRGTPAAAMRNRAITDTFEPGSTMKPFTAALAIDSGRFKATTPIPTAPGTIVVSGWPIKDVHAYGVLSVAEVIQKSSNVGTVKMSFELPAREMWEQYDRVGFGQKPKIGFPGAATGRLRPWKSWYPVEKATMSYGYGLSVSLLQLARAYTVFARDGEVIPVTLEHSDGDGGPVKGTPVLKPETARQIRAMLREAAGDHGTAPKAQTIGYSVGGKSGTARKQAGKAYSNKYRSWFVGLAPVSDPRIVVAVMVDEPSKGVIYGGEIAAPVFSRVVQETLRTMGVAPDIAFKPQIQSRPATAVPESM
jgi:cell division protein FtsI (penicillin-binding protein 3)